MTISTEQFKFLDIQYYLAPGYNLNKFLKAYNAESLKAEFPYEHLNKIADLKSTQFAPYSGFWSSLKQINTLEVESIEFNRLVQQLGSESRALRELGLTEPPETGLQKYTHLSEMFYENKWNFADYLAYYNNKDTEPMITALEQLANYYNERGIDPFKNHISVPGIAGNQNTLTLHTYTPTHIR